MNSLEYLYHSSKDLTQYSTEVILGEKKMLKDELKSYTKKISKKQDALFAEGKQAVLIIFQGMDAAGKDSAIKAIFTGVNPQGIVVSNFKTPSKEEYSHDYLWRHYLRLPPKGKIGIFNRSHYENVLVTRVHPSYILSENLPYIGSVDDIDEQFWQARYAQINAFEKTQIETGTRIIKFMLNVSQSEQHKRFLDRLEEPESLWKFNPSDWHESQLWDQYQNAYQHMLSNCTTHDAPWYIIPCDDKPSARLIMADIILQTLDDMNPRFPEMSSEVSEESEDIYHALKNNKKD